MQKAMSLDLSSESSPPRSLPDDWFIERFKQCQMRLYRFIAAMVPNRADADDLFQKACLGSWQNRHTFMKDCDLFPWLCGIARNHVNDYYRSRHRSPLSLDPEVLDRLAKRQTNDQTTEMERQQALTQCLEKLPQAQRELLRRYYETKDTIRKIAEELGRNPEGLYKTLQRVREALFECMSQVDQS